MRYVAEDGNGKIYGMFADKEDALVYGQVKVMNTREDVFVFDQEAKRLLRAYIWVASCTRIRTVEGI